MNKYVKSFLQRGLIFGGFGPIITGIVLFIISFFAEVTLSGAEVFTAIISTYLLAFVHAGASVFNQIEHWPIAKSLLCHLGSLYIVYSLCYIINNWIPFEMKAFLIFTAGFAAIYFTVWAIVFICVKSATKKMNAKL